MKLIVILLFFIIFVPSIHSYLCSAYCGPGSCYGATKLSCMNTCPIHWNLSVSNCIPDSAAGYTEVAKSTDLGGSIQVSPSNTSTCAQYTFFGSITCTNNFQISLPSGIGVPHYWIEISAWVIILDKSTLQPGKTITMTEGANSMSYGVSTSPFDQQTLCNSATQASYRISLS